MGVRGDFDKLKRLAFDLGETKADLAPELAEALVPDVKRLVSTAFRTQTSPEGEPWPEKKNGEPLKLDHLKQTLVYAHDDKGVTVTVPPPASYHQTGTETDPARSFLPSGDALPEAWKKSIETEVKKLVRRKLKGE